MSEVFEVRFYFTRQVKCTHVKGTGSYVFTAGDGSVMEVSMVNNGEARPKTIFTSNFQLSQNFLNYVDWEYISPGDIQLIATGRVHLVHFPPSLNGRATNPAILPANLNLPGTSYTEVINGETREYKLFKFTLTRNPNYNAITPAVVEGVSRSRRSELLVIDNKRFIVNEKYWVIGLVRESTREHTFIACEGVIGTRAVTYFMDLVTRWDWHILGLLFGRNKGKIRFDEVWRELDDLVDDFGPLYYCKLRLMKPRPGHTVAYAFQHSAADARKLVEAVRVSSKDSKTWPKFNFLGRESLIAASSAQSYSDEAGAGFNCFTWARAQLTDVLHVPKIHLPNNILDKFVSVPSLSLKLSTDSWTQNTLTYIIFFGIIVALISYYLNVTNYY